MTGERDEGKKNDDWDKPTPRKTICGIMGIAVVVLLVYGDIVGAPHGRLTASTLSDIPSQYMMYRWFGADQLRHGIVPLWNPYIFSGEPYLATFQGPILYPVNLLYIVLRTDLALNIDLVLHVFLAGAFTLLWARSRGISPLASFFSGCMFALCGAFVLHAAAGHVTFVPALAWIPLLGMAVDKLIVRPSLGSWLLTAFAAAMELLGGHPNATYIAAVTLGLYSALRLIDAPNRMKSAFYLGSAALASLLLAAGQLWPGISAASESIRDHGLSLAEVNSFTFNWENLVTIVIGGFLGNVENPYYWGEWILWEVCGFIGITGATLAVCGCLFGDRKKQRWWIVLVVVSTVIALGPHTPLPTLLFHVLPGFNVFRSNGRYFIVASVFLALLAGSGLDAIREGKRVPRLFLVALGLWTAIIGASALTVLYAQNTASTAHGIPAWIARFVAWTSSWWPFSRPPTPAGVQYAALWSLVSTVAAGFVAILLALGTKRRWPVYALVVVGVSELVLFTRANRGGARVTPPNSDVMNALKKSDLGDYRVNLFEIPDQAMIDRNYTLSGYDSWMLGRYVRFLGMTQAPDPVFHLGTLLPQKPNPLLALLRCKYFVLPAAEHRAPELLPTPPLPRGLFVRNYRIATDRKSVFAVLNDPTFDPRKTVVLEQEPMLRPDPMGSDGTVQIADVSVNEIAVDAQLTSPAILLITDVYARDWHITPGADSPQQRYEVLPADYVIRAVPLAAGHHRFHMEYSPWAWRLGWKVSAASWVLFLCLCCYTPFRRLRTRTVLMAHA